MWRDSRLACIHLAALVTEEPAQICGLKDLSEDADTGVIRSVVLVTRMMVCFRRSHTRVGSQKEESGHGVVLKQESMETSCRVVDGRRLIERKL
jgi:hypothetical protein